MTDVNKDKGVIFDLDGVLIDTGRFHKEAWYDLAQKQGFEISDEIFYSTFGMQNYQIIMILAGRNLPSEEIQCLSEWKERRYRELAAGKLTLLAGAENLIDNLKHKGFALAIGSSTPRVNLSLMLQQIPMLNCFDAFVTGEEVTKGKPHPDTFLKAAKKLSIAANRCVVVEDAVQGVKAAKAAGMDVVAVTTTRNREDLKQADLIVGSLAELRAEVFNGLLRQKNR